MSALGREITSLVMAEVQVVYLDRETAVWWNRRRSANDTRIFCGFYWIRDQEEAGPFKTRSSAIRDAYYVHVLHREPPAVAHDMQARKQQPIYRKRGRPRKDNTYKGHPA